MLSRPHAPPDLECPCGLCALSPSELALRLAGEVQQRDLPVGKLPPEKGVPPGPSCCQLLPNHESGEAVSPWGQAVGAEGLSAPPWAVNAIGPLGRRKPGT